MSCNGDCENCSSGNDCESCGGDCKHEIKKLELCEGSSVGKIIAVLSGKGGVGKSMVTSLLAVELAKAGKKVGVLDSDITGPSIAKTFGFEGEIYGDDKGIFPHVSKSGIKSISINMMLETEETPVVWRGALLTSVISQFYSEVHWGELDYLLIDMPPGTGDVALTVFQQLPVDEVVMVTTPSKLVSMVVAKAINMTEMVKTPIVGLVDNMAYVKCDNCGHAINIYKEDDTENIAKKYGLNVVSKLPIDPVLANLVDEGRIEEYDGNYLEELTKRIIND